MNPVLHETLLALMIAAAAGLFVWSLLVQHREALDSVGGESTQAPFFGGLWRAVDPYVRLINAISFSRIPTGIGRPGTQVGVLVSLVDALRKLARRLLVRSGVGAVLTPDELLATSVLSTLFGLGAGWYCYLTTGKAVFFLLAGAVGAIYPLLSLRDRAMRRQREIRRFLPYSLDLLTLSVEAGLDFTEALARIVDRSRANALSQEYSAMINEIRLGRSRADALREMGARIDIPEVKSVVASIVQADQLGSNLSPALRIQSAMMRQRQAQWVEAQAGKAPTRIIFPLLLIFGAVVLIIMGPIVIQFVGMP